MVKGFWIGVIAAMVMAGTAWSAPETAALIAETQAALDKGDAQNAANLADEGLKQEGLSAAERGRLFLYRGLAAELLGSHDAATGDFTAALNTHALAVEEQAQALLQRGFLRDGLGHLVEAAKDYTGVIALKGDNLATALNNRANIYRRENRFALAAHDYRAALSASGGKPQYSWSGLGQIAEAQADTLAARGFYAKAVAADPSYVLAIERLEALGGPPDGAVADPQGPIVLHSLQPGLEVGSANQATKQGNGTIVLRVPQGRVSAVTPVGLHPPRREAQNQNGLTSDASLGHSAAIVVLRPALDQPGRRGRARGSAEGAADVQLGAWRSEGEANAGWDMAKLRAGGALDGFSPHIVTADLPGKGRYYRLRVSVAGAQSRSSFCADLSAKGVACLPARD